MEKDETYPILNVFRKIKQENSLPDSSTIKYIYYKTINNINIYADELFVKPINETYDLLNPCFILEVKKIETEEILFLTLMYKHNVSIINGIVVNKNQINKDLKKCAHLS